mmetsp:Transcript_14206/g.32991  ORF Transcript_14206/g.32991 Transcript_14206/m.32991 type:complete len:147 (+) Transcript_14206:1471-1911(+)
MMPFGASIERSAEKKEGGNQSNKNRSFFESATGNANIEHTPERARINQSIRLGWVRFGSVRFVMTCHPGSRMRVCGCRVFRVIWGRSLPRSDGRDHHQELVDVFWDDNHCTPWVPVRVCEELNNLLFLNLLCNTVLHKARRDDDNE